MTKPSAGTFASNAFFFTVELCRTVGTDQPSLSLSAFRQRNAVSEITVILSPSTTHPLPECFFASQLRRSSRLRLIALTHAFFAGILRDVDSAAVTSAGELPHGTQRSSLLFASKRCTVHSASSEFSSMPGRRTEGETRRSQRVKRVVRLLKASGLGCVRFAKFRPHF